MPAPLLSSWLEFLHLQNINREERREGVEYAQLAGVAGAAHSRYTTRVIWDLVWVAALHQHNSWYEKYSA